MCIGMAAGRVSSQMIRLVGSSLSQLVNPASAWVRAQCHEISDQIIIETGSGKKSQSGSGSKLFLNLHYLELISIFYNY